MEESGCYSKKYNSPEEEIADLKNEIQYMHKRESENLSFIIVNLSQAVKNLSHVDGCEETISKINIKIKELLFT